MKIPALLTLLLAAVLSALPMSQARADDVSFDVFYNSLGDQGDWYNTPEYGYVWQPSIAYQNDKWRPYSDGYWAQTDDGWTWVSYENFGWATYHYGRWTNLEGTGWVWVPGYDWGPGWVSWRTSDEYVGWAPLPPKPVSNGGGSSVSIDYNTVEPEQGYDDSVDQQYDIGPANYCFVETRSFGAPVLREVILPPQRNIIIIENTINVTHITYRRGGPRVVVFNGGPDFAFFNGRVDHPIQRLRIEPDNAFDFRNAGRDHNPNVVQNGVFRIAAPTIARRPVNFTQIKPPTVKRDIRDARVEHGWSNTGADQATVQRVRQQFKTQATEHPTRPPGNPAASTTPPVDPRGRERDARTNVVPTPAATPVAGNTPPRGSSDADKRARRDAAQREKDARTNGGQPTPQPSASSGDGSGTGGGSRANHPPTHTPPPVASRPEAAPGTTPIQTPAPSIRRQPDSRSTPNEGTPTPAREVNPERDPRGHNRPSNTPATTPRADVEREERRTQGTPEPRAATPNASTEETRHTPRQQERTESTATPGRNAETERRTERTQEHTPTPAPRQEVRETRETRPQPQPNGSAADDKKKRDGGQQ